MIFEDFQEYLRISTDFRRILTDFHQVFVDFLRFSWISSGFHGFS